MKKTLIYYMLVWLLLVIAYNAIAFLVIPWSTALMTNFWAGYGLFMASAFGFLISGIILFRQENAQKQFLHFSMVNLAWFGMCFNQIVGIILMIVPALPRFLSGAVCILLFIAFLILLILSKAGAQVVEAREYEIKGKTRNMRELTQEAGLLMDQASAETKPVLKEIYEAFRYSDPVSNDALQEVEDNIWKLFSRLKEQVRENRFEDLQDTAQQLKGLIQSRNRLCITLKN